uniref:Microtubule-associated protein n=1 Tax=Electrophorus electricus TaxID=8005 RepID=A0A4W4HL96_ELEEL
MKPEGVDAATMETTVALAADPVVEAAPPGEGQGQTPPTSQTEGTGPGEPQTAETPTAATKTGKTKPSDPKGKTKPGSKTKTPTKTAAAGPRAPTGQGRITNGVQKPQTNGVAKKTALEKKTASTALAPQKKPAASASAGTAKASSARPAGATRLVSAPANGTKTAGTAHLAKKTAVAPANGDKAKPKTTGTHVEMKMAAAGPVSRPTAAALKTATTATSKTSTTTSKPSAVAKTSTSTAKPSPAKSTAPGAGCIPTQPSKTTTPVRKDVSKPSTPAAKKPTAHPVSLPPATKTTKPDTPKAAALAKPESASKKPSAPGKVATDAKSSKPKDSKPAPSKEVSASPRTPSAKNSTAKMASPKKTVGSSTPVPVKRGPKPTQAAEPAVKDGGKKESAPALETAATVNAVSASSAATTATAFVDLTVATKEHDVQAEPTSELAPKPKSEVLSEFTSEVAPESNSVLPAEHPSELLLEPKSEFLVVTESNVVPESKPEFLLEKESELAPESKHEIMLEKECEFAPESKHELLLEKDSELVPESKHELPLEKDSELVPESKHELLLEKDSELVPESKHEFMLETESELVPESKHEFMLETESELVPESKHEIMLEKECELAPEYKHEIMLEKECELEPTVDTLFPVAVEDRAEYTEDTGLEEKTAENVVTELASHMDLGSLRETISAPSPLGTTVMSPPSSPTEYEATTVEPWISAPNLDTHASAEPWTRSEQLFSSAENLKQEQTRSQEHLLGPTESTAEELVVEGKTYLLSTSPLEHLSSGSPTLPKMEREEAVEKAEQEVNEDDHDDIEEEEEEEQEESEVVRTQTMPLREHAEDLKVGLPEYDTSGWETVPSDGAGVSSQQEKTGTTSPVQMESLQADENVDDFFLKKVQLEQPFMGPPGVKSFSDEEEEEEEEDEQVRQSMCAGECHENIPHHCPTSQKEEEQEGEDVERVSEGPMEIGSEGAGKVDEDDYDEGYMDSLSRTAPAPSMPMTAAWGSANPFGDTWAQPASLHMTSSPLDVDTDPETPTKSPAEAWLEQPLGHSADPHLDVRQETEGSVPADGSNLDIPAVGMSQSSTLSGAALAAHSSSETSTPEELRDYDSSSGVESHSDKQQTPVPAAQPDQDQDLGIHLERGDGEEEEAETLPADEVLGDAPTAPASAPSSPSTSGDEASDTEGEMQINDPDAPAGDAAALESPSASRNLPALDEDEEAADMHVGEEDGGTPQSANSVASYGFDCSASNSNAHSTAESSGKSPGIFSLENEDQLPEEAKDPSLIKELTLPPADAHPGEPLGCPVDLLPLAQQAEPHVGLDHQYLLGEKSGASVLEDVDPDSPVHLSPQREDIADEQPPYYSAICDKTDSFLAGNEKKRIQEQNKTKKKQQNRKMENIGWTLPMFVFNRLFLLEKVQ